jgi:NAD(P)-dependent dehydrogenase (short-subunit alcohol dehydrogenase family)
MSGMVDEKVVLITGGGSGMGQAGAGIFAREGASHVYVADVNEEGGAQTVADVEAVGGKATFVAVDVTDAGAVQRLVDRIVDEQGRIDAAWNNAGINDTSVPFHELTIEAWDRMVAVNLTSVFYCMKYEIPPMLRQGGGAIVNTSSGAGLVAAPGLPHYTAAKHGVLGITKVAASEFNKQGIRVNAVCPGVIDTPMIRSWNLFSPELVASLPGGGLGKPQHVAEAAVWLCSDHAEWISGVSMVVDGGGMNR